MKNNHPSIKQYLCRTLRLAYKRLLPACLLCAALTGCDLYRYTALDENIETIGTIRPDAPVNADQPVENVDSPITDPFMGVEITFLAAGDNLIHPNIYQDAQSRGTAEKEYDFLPMYTDVADFVAEADFAFINQETLMAGEAYGYSGYPTFNSPQQLGRDLVQVGFDIVGLANNHMLDRRDSGLYDNVLFWNSLPVTTIGASIGEAAPAFLEKDGVTIGMLSYTYGTNGITQGADAVVKVPYIDRDRIIADLDALAESKPDITIVSMHWGIENVTTPSDEQRELAQMLADCGVDVILGHHPHCLQPIEWLTGQDGNRTLCIYSLGNLLSGMARPINQVGGFLQFSIVSDGAGDLMIDHVSFRPTVFYYGPGWYNTHLYFLEDYTDEIAATHGVQLSGYTLTAAEARAIVENVIDPAFLPQTNE